MFVNGALLFGDIRDLPQRKLNSRELRLEWCNAVSEAYGDMFGTLLVPRRLTVKNIKRSLMGNCEKHSLVPYKAGSGKRIECKMCRHFRTTINKDGKVVSKRKLTFYKCDRCDVAGQPCGFCSSTCWNAWPLHTKWQLPPSDDESSAESDPECVFCGSAGSDDDENNPALKCSRCRATMHSQCLGLEKTMCLERSLTFLSFFAVAGVPAQNGTQTGTSIKPLYDSID